MLRQKINYDLGDLVKSVLLISLFATTNASCPEAIDVSSDDEWDMCEVNSSVEADNSNDDEWQMVAEDEDLDPNCNCCSEVRRRYINAVLAAKALAANPKESAVDINKRLISTATMLKNILDRGESLLQTGQTVVATGRAFCNSQPALALIVENALVVVETALNNGQSTIKIGQEALKIGHVALEKVAGMLE
jgi:hypothetical protein